MPTLCCSYKKTIATFWIRALLDFDAMEEGYQSSHRRSAKSMESTYR